MALDFPSSPVNGQVYDNFVYDSTRGTWKSLSAGASPSILVGPTITNPTINDAVITATATSASTIPITVRGAASQSANLQEWKNSSNISLSYIDSTGKLFAPDLSLTKNTAHIEIGGITGTSNTPYIDFHSGSTATDYDTRIIASGGNGVNAGGRIDIQSASVYHSGLNTSYGNPSFQAYKSSHTTASAYLVFDQAWSNIGGAYNASNGRFTAPIAGRYLVSFSTLLFSMGSASSVYMLVNGVQQTFMGVYGQFTGSYAGQGGTHVINLNANDYVQWYFTHNGTSLHSGYTVASGYFLG